MQYALIGTKLEDASGRLYLTWNDKTMIFAAGNTAASVLSPAKADIAIWDVQGAQIADTRDKLIDLGFRDFDQHLPDETGRIRARSAQLA